jgi:hypothetical protein
MAANGLNTQELKQRNTVLSLWLLNVQLVCIQYLQNGKPTHMFL